MDRDETYIRPLESIRLRCQDCASTHQGIKDCKFTDCSLYILLPGRNVAKCTSLVKS